MENEWKEEFEDRVYYDNSGNGGFSEWVGLEEHDLIDLFKQWLGVGKYPNDKPAVIVRCREGALLLEVKDA